MEIINCWHNELERAIISESKLYSTKWVQLATISNDNQPRVRTVVFRKLNKNNSIDFLTDKRSNKVKEIKQNPSVEICWMFYSSLSQFRFRGKAEEINDKSLIKDYWNRLSFDSREMWFGPSPGSPLKTSESLAKKNNKKELIPNNFLLIRAFIHEVEMLALSINPHSRTIWKSKNNWLKEYINP